MSLLVVLANCCLKSDDLYYSVFQMAEFFLAATSKTEGCRPLSTGLSVCSCSFSFIAELVVIPLKKVFEVSKLATPWYLFWGSCDCYLLRTN